MVAVLPMQSAFGEALKGVQQVGAIDTSATIASVDAHLDTLRPAISNYGGSVVVRTATNPDVLNDVLPIDAHVDMLQPAISNYGGSVVVRAAEGSGALLCPIRPE